MSYKRAEFTVIVFAVEDIITTSDMMPSEVTEMLATTTSNKPNHIEATIAEP